MSAKRKSPAAKPKATKARAAKATKTTRAKATKATKATKAKATRAKAQKPKWDPALVRGHKNYVKAINSNDTDQVMAMYDEGAVVMQPDGPLVEGRANLRAWVAGYFDAFKTHWTKVSDVMWVAGEFGFDQGHDKCVDLPILRDAKGKVTGYGKPVRQHVKGILIYKRQANGEFKVYRDIWNFNKPAELVRS